MINLLPPWRSCHRHLGNLQLKLETSCVRCSIITYSTSYLQSWTKTRTVIKGYDAVQKTTCNVAARESLIQPPSPGHLWSGLGETLGHSEALPAASLVHGTSAAEWSCVCINLILQWLIINTTSVRFGGEEIFSFCWGKREMIPLNNIICINNCAFYPRLICQVLLFGRSLCAFWCVKQDNGLSLLKGLQIGQASPRWEVTLTVQKKGWAEWGSLGLTERTGKKVLFCKTAGLSVCLNRDLFTGFFFCSKFLNLPICRVCWAGVITTEFIPPHAFNKSGCCREELKTGSSYCGAGEV